MAAVVLFRLHCTIMMRGSSFDLKFSWALHAKTPLHVFLIGFYFKCSFEGVLLWRGNRNAANAPHLSTPLCAGCGSLYPDFSLSLVFFDSLHALISTPISFWLWVILQPQLKIDMVWQWQSAMLNYWKSLWLCLLPIWPSLIVSSAILHSKIISIVIYCRAKRYHQKKSHLLPFALMWELLQKKKAHLCVGVQQLLCKKWHFLTNSSAGLWETGGGILDCTLWLTLIRYNYIKLKMEINANGACNWDTTHTTGSKTVQLHNLKWIVHVCACVCDQGNYKRKRNQTVENFVKLTVRMEQKKKRNSQDLDSGEGGEILETAKSLLDFFGFFGWICHGFS